MSEASNPWAALAPDLREREAFLQDLARQVRLQVRAGKTAGEVQDWLQTLGLSDAAAAYFLMTCSRDPGIAPTVGAAERRGERHERRRKSKRLAATEPDRAFALPGDSYAQVIARDVRRGSWGGVVTLIVVALVSFPLGMALLSFLFK